MIKYLTNLIKRYSEGPGPKPRALIPRSDNEIQYIARCTMANFVNWELIANELNIDEERAEAILYSKATKSLIIWLNHIPSEIVNQCIANYRPLRL